MGELMAWPVALVVGLLIGGLLAWLWVRSSTAATVAAARTQAQVLTDRVADLETALAEDTQLASVLAPLRDTLGRVERQVGVLERDRAGQYGELGARLDAVGLATDQLRTQTADLVGALSSSSVRGAWGEAQLRRLLEVSGLLARCDVDEQVRAVTIDGVDVRPDAVLRLPGGKVVVIDAKAPMTRFLDAQSASLPAPAKAQAMAAHARAVRGHVDALSTKAYWTAFPTTPEMVVAFLPTDAMLAAALDHDPGLYDEALGRHVILASPATLHALLRTVAFTWQHDALTTQAQELLTLGKELYARLGTLAGHTTKLGSSLTRSVEAYNALVGSLETRVLVTARKMHELDLASTPVAQPTPLEVPTRPLTSMELLDALETQVGRPEIDPSLAHPERRSGDRDRAGGGMLDPGDEEGGTRKLA